MTTTHAALVAAALFGAASLAATTANAAPVAPMTGFGNTAVIRVDDMHRHEMHHMRHMMHHERRMMHRQHRMMRHMHHRMMHHHDHMD